MFLDDEGTYHLYYQCRSLLFQLPQLSSPLLTLLRSDNPTANVAGNQHWGHTTSKDLYHWTNQPIAIYPTYPNSEIFSGSAVIDRNNTSGFFPNQANGVVAIYTLNNATEQTQEIAYSRDNGFTFTKYEGNPVLSVNSSQFRDPKVLWYSQTQLWVMVVSYASDFTIGIFTSPDLKTWSHASNFTSAGLLGIQYECPNLVAIPMLSNASTSSPLSPSNFASTAEQMYVLVISINPGAPLGGSISQYFPGTFNGTHFSAVDAAARIADFGKDNYAGQFFYNIPSSEPQISIAWASNWQYSQVVPTGPLENFRSFMSLPRRNVLANITNIGYDLISTPYDLTPLYTTPEPLVQNASLGNSSLMLSYPSSSVPSGALSFTVNITSIPAVNVTGTLNFTFLSSSTGEALRGGYFLGSSFWLDRSGIQSFPSYNPLFTSQFSVNSPLDPQTNSFSLQGVIDRSILEVFLDGGQRSTTTTYFPQGMLDTLIIAANDLNTGVGVSVSVFGLDSAWGSGTVTGNITSTNSQRIRRDGWMDSGYW